MGRGLRGDRRRGAANATRIRRLGRLSRAGAASIGVDQGVALVVDERAEDDLAGFVDREGPHEVDLGRGRAGLVAVPRVDDIGPFRGGRPGLAGDLGGRPDDLVHVGGQGLDEGGVEQEARRVVAAEVGRGDLADDEPRLDARRLHAVGLQEGQQMPGDAVIALDLVDIQERQRVVGHGSVPRIVGNGEGRSEDEPAQVVVIDQAAQDTLPADSGGSHE